MHANLPPFLRRASRGPALVGMVHLHALPGSPRAAHSVQDICEHAASQAAILAGAGFDALLIENMHDVPYVLSPHPPCTVAAMTAAALRVREAAPGLPLGVQVLACGEREALAVALATGAHFIRCENFVFSHVADEGLLGPAAAGPLLRERANLGCEHIAVFADIKKKHAAHAITADVSIADAAHAAEFFGADGLIVTGQSTGQEASAADLAAVKSATGLPVAVGSGIMPANIARFAEADMLIVGSAIKHGGDWRHDIDPARCDELVRARDRCRAAKS
ncbi:MAG: BtpA/SgcQ family protein [Phycisphaeraceae bacterium]|nr:BtpA/SgcQ family protein [Phycisphaeraceae bacterium]